MTHPRPVQPRLPPLLRPDVAPARLTAGTLTVGTRMAFTLFASVTFAAAVGFHPALFDLLAMQGSALGAEYQRCLDVTTGRLPAACARLDSNAQLIADGTGLCFLAMLLLAAIQYALAPRWRIWRRRLRPIGRVLPASPGGVRGELTWLQRRALGDGQVSFLVDIVNPAVDGLAFGRRDQHYVALSRGLLAAYGRDRRAFRAVVLHELAHVRNGDLAITAATLALWRSFVLVIMVPGTIAALAGILTAHPETDFGHQVPGTSGAGLAWLFAVQLAGLGGLAWLTRYCVLRSRELDADAWAAHWLGDPAPLLALFAARPGGRPGPARRGRWAALRATRRRTHPHLKARLAALSAPGAVLRQEFGFAFALGACCSLAVDPAVSATSRLTGNLVGWPIWPFTVGLALVLWVTAYRAALAPRPAGAQRARLGLAAGLAAGAFLAPSFTTDHALGSYPEALQAASLLPLVLAGWLLACWAQWVTTGARRAFGAVPLRGVLSFALSGALVIGVVYLSGGAIYQVRADVFLARLARTPPVTSPVRLVALVGQISLDSYAQGARWLPACLGLLLAAPLLLIIRHQDWFAPAPGPPAPVPLTRARRWAFPVAACGAALAVWLTGTAAQSLNQVIFTSPGSAGYTRLLDQAAETGAAVAVAVAVGVAVSGRSAPVLRAVLCALGAGLAYLAIARTGWLAVSPPLTWPDWSLALAQTVEAALLVAFAVTAVVRPLIILQSRRRAAAGAHRRH